MPSNLIMQIIVGVVLLVILNVEPVRKLANWVIVIAMVFAIGWHVSRAALNNRTIEAHSPPPISTH